MDKEFDLEHQATVISDSDIAEERLLAAQQFLAIAGVEPIGNALGAA